MLVVSGLTERWPSTSDCVSRTSWAEEALELAVCGLLEPSGSLEREMDFFSARSRLLVEAADDDVVVALPRLRSFCRALLSRDLIPVMAATSLTRVHDESPPWSRDGREAVVNRAAPGWPCV